jgi:hypothetical protein
MGSGSWSLGGDGWDVWRVIAPTPVIASGAKQPRMLPRAQSVVTMTLTHALLFGPKAAFMPELFRAQVRYSGASLGVNVAAALSGGFRR